MYRSTNIARTWRNRSPFYTSGRTVRDLFRICLAFARAAPAADETEQRQACREQHKIGGLGNSRYCTKQPGRLAIDTVGEIKRVGVAAITRATAENQSPQAAGSVADADIDRDRAP